MVQVHVLWHALILPVVNLWPRILCSGDNRLELLVQDHIHASLSGVKSHWFTITSNGRPRYLFCWPISSVTTALT
jgi:hypothetical protein